MKICAFDIGIKNLSFCIIEQLSTNFQVLKWELINLSTEQKTCIGVPRKNITCDKKATMSCKEFPDLCFCSLHSKQFRKPKFAICECDEEHKCMYVTSKECNKKSTSQIADKYYCSTHAHQVEKQFDTSYSICKIKKKSCMKESLQILGDKMYTKLEQLPEILEVDKIVIENQPSFKNPTMKSISILLFAYFVMKHFQNIDFVSPSGKLKINETLTNKILKGTPKKDKYKNTKKLAIIYCQKLLEKDSNKKSSLKILDNPKKKDDLCDAFLHGYYHLIGNTGLEQEDFVKDTLTKFEIK